MAAIALGYSVRQARCLAPPFCAAHKKCLKPLPHCTMLHCSKGSFDVVGETKIEEKIEAVTETVAAPVKAVAEKVEAVSAPTKVAVAKAKPAAKKPARRPRKAPAKLVEAVKQVNKRAAK